MLLRKWTWKTKTRTMSVSDGRHGEPLRGGATRRGTIIRLTRRKITECLEQEGEETDGGQEPIHKNTSPDRSVPCAKVTLETVSDT